MDAEEYRRASRDVWSAVAPGWDRRSPFFEQIARSVTERMLAHLAPRAVGRSSIWPPARAPWAWPRPPSSGGAAA